MSFVIIYWAASQTSEQQQPLLQRMVETLSENIKKRKQG